MSYTHSRNHNTPIYVTQGGQEFHLGGPAAGPLNSAGGAVFIVGANATPIGYVATITPAASTANICLVTIQFQDGVGNNLGVPVDFDLLLSDAATGTGLTAVTASGAVAASGTAGIDLATLTTKKALRCQSDATGKYVLSITDTAKTGFYIAVSGGFGNLIVSAQLVAANYG